MSEEQVKEEVIQDTSLGEMFDGEADIPEPEIKGEDVPEKPTGELEKDSEADTPKEDPDKAAPPAEDKPDYEKQLKAQIAKAKDERQKRQALERKILDSEQKVEVPDAFAEPDKAIQHAKAELRQEFQNQFLSMSEQNAKARHVDDFDDMTELFFEKLMIENPALQAEAMNQVDPYEFVYRTAKNHLEMSQLTEAGGVEEYRKQIEKEVREKVKAEQADEEHNAVEKKITESIPDSLSSKRAAGGNKAELNLSDTPLDNLFG